MASDFTVVSDQDVVVHELLDEMRGEEPLLYAMSYDEMIERLEEELARVRAMKHAWDAWKTRVERSPAEQHAVQLARAERARQYRGYLNG